MNNILIIKPTRCTNFSNLFLEWNSTCFGQFLCPSSGVFHCTRSNGICHTDLLAACEQDQDGTEFHLDPDPLIPYYVKFFDEKALGKVKSTYIHIYIEATTAMIWMKTSHNIRRADIMRLWGARLLRRYCCLYFLSFLSSGKTHIVSESEQIHDHHCYKITTAKHLSSAKRGNSLMFMDPCIVI